MEFPLDCITKLNHCEICAVSRTYHSPPTQCRNIERETHALPDFEDNDVQLERGLYAALIKLTLINRTYIFYVARLVQSLRLDDLCATCAVFGRTGVVSRGTDFHLGYMLCLGQLFRTAKQSTIVLRNRLAPFPRPRLLSSCANPRTQAKAASSLTTTLPYRDPYSTP